MSDKNIEIIKHIQATGRCPEDDMMATNSFTESGFQPKTGNKFTFKKSIDTNPPKISKKNEEVEIDYSNSLFDPNEKDPAMRALNMVKEYCNISVREINQNKAISTDCFKADAYQDVINFIEEHQNKCHTIKNQELKHIQNEAGWYKKRMEEYRKSFFMVCDLIKSSNVPESIKYFVEREEKRY